MSQRTDAGAYVDAMLTAYRRTLRKTMEQARDIGEVVEDPEIAKLADTPDKAVVWGMALGLRDEVSALLPAASRSSARPRARPPAPTTRSGSARIVRRRLVGGIGRRGRRRQQGSGSAFCDSAIPDIGGMFSALGSVGSSPPSSSSSSSSGGGGFSGGGGGGGGGGSGSF